MEKTVLQIEGVPAAELLGRLEAIEKELAKIATAQEHPTSSEEMMTRKQVAALFSVTLPTVHDWINKGVLRAYKAGGKTYFKRTEIEAVFAVKRPKYGTC